VDFGVIDRLITFSISGRYRRKRWEYTDTVLKLIIDFKKANDQVGGKVYTTILSLEHPGN
jgi:hypothetical protein